MSLFYLHGIDCYCEANECENYRDRTEPALNVPIIIDPSVREVNCFKNDPSNYKHEHEVERAIQFACHLFS